MGLAIAREVGVPLTIEDLNQISINTPVITDLTPGGKYVAVDMHRAGGTRQGRDRTFFGPRFIRTRRNYFSATE